ncbi:MAG: PLD nuclease N-terminal domain-containing protein [Planctomycetota bacterium]
MDPISLIAETLEARELHLELLLPIAGILLLLEMIALVDLLRRPPKLARGGRRWPWLLVIVLLSGFGWALYLLFGRLSEPDLEEPP